MPTDIVTTGIPHEKLAPELAKIKKKVFNHPVVKDMLKKYKIDKSELDLIPMCFAKLPVSARTDHGIIYINVDVPEADRVVHELTHYCQQTTGNKPTPGSTEDNYLDNPVEQEGFRNQTKFIADTKGEEAAEEYIDDLLDYHTHDKKDEKKREDRREKLIDLASEFGIDLSKIAG